jgi:two-component sensor histidine kinase
MPDKIITLPRLINENCSNFLMERLGQNEIDTDDMVILDAQNVHGISPCGTILLSNFALSRLIINKSVKLILPNHPETKQYIENSGLLKITQSTNINDAIDSKNVQLRLLHGMEPMVPESLSMYVTQLAGHVNEDEKYLLRMWITELLTNANDHAKSNAGFWVCGRYNNDDHKIRICVADSGIGIKQSLVNADKIPNSISDANAIVKALEEGMTSRAGKTGGLGLKHISSYIKSHGGSMTILSGTGKVYLAQRKQRVTKNHLKYQGTIVNVMFNAKYVSSSGDNIIDQTPFTFE